MNMAVQPRRRLGWLGPAIVALGAAVAALGVWWMIRSKPAPGDVIDTLDIGDGAKVVVRAEKGGDRAFVELHEGGEMKWQALVPPYAGRKGAPGIGWSEIAISVRVVRDGKAEVFALARKNASKLGGTHLATDRGAIKKDATGPVTVTDGKRAYEIIAGDTWNQLSTMDLQLGTLLWTKELGAIPVEQAGVEGGLVWVEQAGKRRYFQVFNGKEDRSVERIGPPPQGGVPPAWPTTAPDTAPVTPAQPSLK